MYKKVTGIFLIFALVATGCSSSQAIWYKNGAGQADFNIDDAECRVIAERMGRQATLTGKKSSIQAYAKAYDNCIYNRGWSKQPPAVQKDKTTAGQGRPLAQLKEGFVYAFNRQFAVPKGFFQTGNTISTGQGLKNQFLTFENPRGMALNLTFQSTVDRKFEKTDFPVRAPFFIYDAGGEPEQGRKIRWTVFAGQFQNNWLAGIGSYFLVDPANRVTIIISSQIKAPDGVPPQGLKLTENQKNDVDAFEEKWIHNFKTAFGACLDCEKKKTNFWQQLFIK